MRNLWVDSFGGGRKICKEELSQHHKIFGGPRRLPVSEGMQSEGCFAHRVQNILPETSGERRILDIAGRS